MTGQPLHNNISPSEIESAVEQVRSALGSTTDEDARSAPQRTQYDGSIEYTFEDEDFEPFGRAIDVRIYYRWRDYDPADGPHTVWGASIEELEVLAIRHFDKFGNEVAMSKHSTDAAWHLLEKTYEQVTEACTEDGYRRGVGKAPLTYAPGKVRKNPPSTFQKVPANFGSRMAPSISTRPTQVDRRELG